MSAPHARRTWTGGLPMIGSVRPGVRLAALVAGVATLAMPAGGASAVPVPPVDAELRTATPAAASGDPDQLGTWKVADHGGGAYTLRWTSPSSLPVTDDRP